MSGALCNGRYVHFTYVRRNILMVERAQTVLLPLPSLPPLPQQKYACWEQICSSSIQISIRFLSGLNAACEHEKNSRQKKHLLISVGHFLILKVSETNPMAGNFLPRTLML